MRRLLPAVLCALSTASGCFHDPTSTDEGGGPYRFELRAPGADSVFVEGSFNQWAPRDPEWRMDWVEGSDSTLQAIEADHLPERFSYHYAVYAQGREGRIEDPFGTASGDLRLDPFQTRVDRGLTPPRPLPAPIDPSRLVIYEMLVSDFSAGGGFAEVVEALEGGDHPLVELGINALELMPVHPVPGDFSWGYDCGSHWSVDPGYGGARGLRDLVDACHARGIAVLLDVVLNHSGGHHPISELEWLTGRYYYYDPSKENAFGLPEYDWDNADLIDYFVEGLAHFIEDLGIDGFRYDFVEGEAYSDWAKVVLPLKERFPETFHIAESFDSSGGALDPAIGFDAQWGGQSSSYGGSVNNYHQRLNANLAESAYVNRYGGVIGTFSPDASPMLATADVTEFHPGRGSWRDIKYLESHDERRVVEQVEGSGSSAARAIGGLQKSRLGAISLMTCVGIPLLYHGQEIGVDNPIAADPAPSPIDWTAGDASLRDHYRHLIELRLGEPALASDAIEFLWAAGSAPSAPDETARILQYLRGEEGQEVLVLLNFDHEEHQVVARFPRQGAWALFDPATGGRDETLEVPPGGEVEVLVPASDGLIYLNPS